jgi:hypothetical protein
MMPQLSDYQASNQATNAHIAAYQNLHGVDAVVPPLIATRPADLSTTAKTAYKEDMEFYRTQMDYYKAQNQEYQHEQSALDKITQEMQRTVNNHLYTNCCVAGQTHRQWLQNLMATVGIDPEDEIRQARDRYKAALKPPRTMAQWETWLTEVDQSTTEGKAVGIPECLSDTYIKEDFTRATIKHAEQWTISFRATGLLNPLVPVKEMFRQYRDYATLMYPSKPKGSKAAFSATAPILDEDESDEPGQKRKKRRNRKPFNDEAGTASLSRSTTRSNTIQRTTSKCEACDMRHALKDCWYAHPGNAPDWWKPQEDRMEQARRRIENSPSMQDAVRGTKRPARSSTPAMKKSHSATPTVTLEED